MLGARKPLAVLYGTSRAGRSMRVDDVSGLDCAAAIVGAIERRKRAIRSFETIGSLVAISGRPARLLRERSTHSVLTRIQCRAGVREDSKRRATEYTEKSGHGLRGIHGEVRATDSAEDTEKTGHG